MMTQLGRVTPELRAAILYSDSEITALQDFASDRHFPEPGNVGRAVPAIEMLGGYLNRRKEPPPGHQQIWDGACHEGT